MKKLAQFTTKLICLMAVLGWSMSAYGQGVNKARPLGSTSSPYGYYEYLPVDYNSNSNNYPVLIFLHGMGERGNGTTQLWEAIEHGPQREVEKGRDFPFIIVSPQSDVWWSVDKVNSFVEWVKNKYRVNADKVYMTGLSMGGISTFDYVNKYPNQLAAIVPIAGENKKLSNSCNITKVKLWAFHGDADPTISVQHSKDAVKYYNACNPSPLAKLTIYPNVNHNSWTRTYDGSAGHDIYKWMLQYSRGTTRTTNAAPTASAGSDKTITLPTNSITLYGSASDSDGSIASTTWTKVNGPSASMSGTSTTTLKLSSLVAGTYTFRLTAKDNGGATKSDDVVVTVKSSTSDPVSSTNGLNYKYYTTSSGNAWTLLPNFSNLTPAKTGTVSNFSLAPKTQSNYFGFVFEGQVQIDASGTYTFYSYSDDGSQLFINGNMIVNNNGTHGAQEKSGSVYLAAGKHNIKVTYFDYVNGETLAVKYAGPGISKQLIPNSKLFKGSSTTSNAAPTASAGSDKTITLPTNSITLYGSASDSDGSIASTTWTKVNGPSASMSGTSTTTLKLSSLVAGTYTFRLTAKDNGGATKSDDVVVTVKSSTSTSDPVSSTNGLNYKYYTTTSGSPWKVLPNFSSLSPAKTGTVTNFSIAPKTQSNYFAFMFEGQIQIDVAGTYTFYTYSDDGSQLFINGNLVANNDGAHAAQERSGSVSLAAGRHNIKVTYFDHISSEVLTVKYAGPGIGKQTIPNSKLYTGSGSGSTSKSSDSGDSYSGTAPSSLSAVANPYTTGAGLSWKDNSSNEKGFEIFMSVGNNSSYKQVGSTGSNKTSYGVGISKGQVYYFKIRAKVGTGHTSFSNEVRLSTVSGSSSALVETDSLFEEETSSLAAIAETAVYPNPATDHINISLGSEFSGKVSLQLVNMAGQVSLSESVDAAEATTVRLDLNQTQLQPGIYILKLNDGIHQKSLKILKK